MQEPEAIATNKEKQATHYIGALLLGLVLLILPIQPLWIRPLETLGISSELLFFLKNWAGPIILLLGAISLGVLLSSFRKLIISDFLILLFLAIAVLSFFWHPGSGTDYIIGLRYSAFSTLAYFIGRTISSSEGLWDQLLKGVLIVLAVIGVIQFVLVVVDARWLMESLGLQVQHFAGPWPRLNGPMAGPNQLGTLLALSSLWLFWQKKISIPFLLLTSTLVVLTFSRSALLGLALGLLVPFVLVHTSNGKHWRSLGLFVLVVAAVGLALVYIEPLQSAFIGERHTDLRLLAFQESLDKIGQSSFAQILVGHGAGTAGPAAFITGTGFIPENWFLQIFYEYGLFGLLFLLSFFLFIAVEALKNKAPAVIAIIVAVVINSLFLHPLSDNAPAALWFYFLLGASVISFQQKSEGENLVSRD